MKRKVSRTTEAVQRAQAGYPKALAASLAYLGDIPYMQKKIDQRTFDRRAASLTDVELMTLQQTDPASFEKVGARLAQIDARSAANPVPLAEYEGDRDIR